MAEDAANDSRDAILARADALIGRHRRPAEVSELLPPAPAPAPEILPQEPEAPAPAEAASPDDDIPLLTDVVTPAGAKPSAMQGTVMPEMEVISRVQNQNVEHTAYLRVMSQVDDRITNVVKQRVMPEIGSALDEALARITNDLKASISEMVRTSIQESLRTQLPAPAAAPALPNPETSAPSGIIPPSPAPAPSSTSHTMELAKSFEPAAIEARWYPEWEKAGYFKAGADAAKSENYCILLPPPNVTGTLHMGHAFQHTLMDALTRYHRMSGNNTLWQPGTDHAGIATQIVVERQLDAQKIARRDLGREKFLERVWQWKEESGSTITRQMRRLGSSCDWERERFTMDEGLSRTVTETFVRLYAKGLIYRGKRLVNWDPVLQTAVSDLEVESVEEDGKIWHISYPFASGAGYLEVATTRPETLLGDVAVAVNPEDARYSALIGSQLVLPLSGRSDSGDRR